MLGINISTNYKQELSVEEFNKLMRTNCVDHAIYDMRRNIPVIISCSSPVWPMRLTQCKICVSKCELHCILKEDTVDITIQSYNTQNVAFVLSTVSLSLETFITFADEAIATPNVVILYDNNNFRSSNLPLRLSSRT